MSMTDDNAWIQPLREFLRTGDMERLRAACDAAADEQISGALKAAIQTDGAPEDPQAVLVLAGGLRQTGRTAAAAAVEILALRPQAVAAGQVEQFPPDQKEELVRECFAACERCRVLAQQAHFDELQAKFAGILATGLAKLRRLSAAGERYEEALDVYRHLAAREPHVYKPDVAMTLNNLGNVLSEQRAFPEATAAYEEALEACRDLAAREPHIYEPYVAVTLNNLGNVLAEQRAFPKARAAYEKALGACRDLAARKPHIYRPDVAMTLNNLGVVLSEQRAFPEARAACEEALVIRRDLAAQEPHIYNPYVADTVNIVCSVLNFHRAFPEARAAYEKALSMRRDLAAREPYIYMPQVARTLNNLGNVLGDQGAFPEATAAYEEALGAYRDLAAREPHVYQPDVAMTLNNLGTALGDQRVFPEARAAYEEALGAYRDLAAREPRIYKPYVAGTLNNLGNVLGEMGKAEEALRAHRKAVEAAEAEGLDEERRSLAKRNAVSSYRFLVEHSATQGDQHGLFGYLAARRERDYLATRPEVRGGLAEACQAVGDLGKWLKQKVSILIVEPLPQSALFALLTANGIQLEVRPNAGKEDWPAGLGDLMAAYNDWFRAGDLVAEISRRLRTARRDGDAEAERLLEKELLPAKRERALAAERIRNEAAAAFASLPAFVQDALHPYSGQYTLLSTTGGYDRFPFEVLRYGEGEADYVGVGRALTRIMGISAAALGILRPATAGDEGRTVLVVANPNKGNPALDLPVAEQEGQEVWRQLSSFGYRAPTGGALVGEAATFQAFCDGLAAQPAIVHYAGHGTIPPPSEDVRRPSRADIGEESLVLRDAPFGPFTLREREITLSGSPLIVLNSCRTGWTRLSGGEREDLAGSLLHRGAGAVIASAFPVHDNLGAVFGMALYSAHPASAAYAFLQARVSVERLCSDEGTLRPLWPSWALLTYHGNPRLRLPHHTGTDRRKAAQEPERTKGLLGLASWIAGMLGIREETVQRALDEGRKAVEAKQHL